MRCKMAFAAGMSLIAASASATTPANGLWRTPEDGGRVEITDVGGAITGRLVGSARLDAEPSQRDEHNADPSLRNRTLKGVPLFSGMLGQSPLWKGKMYSPVDGKTYSATLKLLDAGTLKLTGCVVVPFCRSQTWTRVH